MSAPRSPAATLLLPIYIEHRERDVAAVRRALDVEDFRTIARIGHNLHGNARSYGFPELATLGEALEGAALARRAEGVRAPLRAIEAWLNEEKARGGRGERAPPALPASGARLRAAAPAELATGDRHAAGSRLAGVRVLVVDDDDDVRDLISSLLVEQGATVARASSARGVLRMIEEESPDVLLSDVGMPDVDGYSLLRTIRGMPADRGGTIPAIALTAYARPGDGERALAAGFQAHVIKPVDPDLLAAVVAEVADLAPPDSA